MDELWVHRVYGDSSSMLALSCDIRESAPLWYLHGMTPLPADPEDEDCYSAVVWGEGKFTQNGLLPGEPLVDYSDLTPLSEEEKSMVLQDAMLQALVIALRPENALEFGEVLLKKHPECRNAETPEEAIIKAALLERRSLFSEEDYEDF